MRFSVTATFATVTLTMGVAACGGGGSDGDKLSRAELAKEANAICADFRKEIAEVPRAPASNAETIVDTVERTRAVLRGTVDKLEKLKPQDSVSDDWQSYVDKENEAVGLLDTFLTQIADRDRRAQQTLSQINAVVGQERAAALRIGADTCASKPAAAPLPAGSSK